MVVRVGNDLAEGLEVAPALKWLRDSAYHLLDVCDMVLSVPIKGTIIGAPIFNQACALEPFQSHVRQLVAKHTRRRLTIKKLRTLFDDHSVSERVNEVSRLWLDGNRAAQCIDW